jgi:hypothetical protein
VSRQDESGGFVCAASPHCANRHGLGLTMARIYNAAERTKTRFLVPILPGRSTSLDFVENTQYPMSDFLRPFRSILYNVMNLQNSPVKILFSFFA